MTWQSSALGERHELSRFRCGHDVLDAWLRDQALRAERAGVSRTTVWTAADDHVVVAFHAIAPTSFVRTELPGRKLAGGYTVVPGYLLGRLALDERLHGQGLGSQLLLDALERIVAAASEAGGRLIAVDAVDEDAHRFYRHHPPRSEQPRRPRRVDEDAHRFYRDHDFQPIDGSTRLVMKVSTAQAALAPGGAPRRRR